MSDEDSRMLAKLEAAAKRIAAAATLGGADRQDVLWLGVLLAKLKEEFERKARDEPLVKIGRQVRSSRKRDQPDILRRNGKIAWDAVQLLLKGETPVGLAAKLSASHKPLSKRQINRILNETMPILLNE